MKSSFNNFKRQLDDALKLLESSEQIKRLALPQVFDAQMVDTESLLARCDQICEKHKNDKPTIRVIHHLACSGGSLISKCISALPNVYLLSEVHPYSDLGKNFNKYKYVPSDIVTLCKYAGIPNQRYLAGTIFTKSIDEVYKHLTNMGAVLVLRDHSHADFHTEEIVPEKSSIVSLLEDKYDVLRVLTLRNPIDSYNSLLRNKWVHFEPKSFEEYCRRALLFVDDYRDEEIILYEDFIRNPEVVMRQLANKLELPFDSLFEDIYSTFKTTGESGRQADVIEEQQRKDISGDFKIEIDKSLSFKKLAKRFGFK